MRAVEIRKVSGAVDEIIAHNCIVHLERLTGDGWYLGITSADGLHQVYLGAKNGISHVEVRYIEHTPASSPDMPSPDQAQT